MGYTTIDIGTEVARKMWKWGAVRISPAGRLELTDAGEDAVLAACAPTRAENDRLRAGIEALLSERPKYDDEGIWYAVPWRLRLRNLLEG